MKKIYNLLTGIAAFILLACSTLYAGMSDSDTVILKFRNNASIVIIADENDDLELITAYDLNKILENLNEKIETENGTVILVVNDEFSDYYLKETHEEIQKKKKEKTSEFHYTKRTKTSWNIDVGMNNYLEEDGSFPDDQNAPYTIRPWGSWYIGFFTIFKTRVAGPLFLEWGGGIDWYTFKYENTKIRMSKNDTGVSFIEDPRPAITPIKSKLSITYLDARIIPVLDFSKNREWGRDRLWNEDIGSGFRIGFGPYVGYRIDSWSKYTFRENNNKEKKGEKSNYYLNNFRYGARFQVGFKGVDLFVNYDLNKLYSESKDTPGINAFTFGFTL